MSKRTAKETMTLVSVSEALTTALTQVTNLTEQRLATQEFWHSLNRKRIIRNDEVQSLIDLTLIEVEKQVKRRR